ncbi:MAG: hypothetical protein ACKVOE_02530 [Rickettsiales bacterium]
MEQSAAAELTAQTDALAQNLSSTPAPAMNEAATAGIVNRASTAPPEAHNDTVGRVSETLRAAAEKHLSDYIGTHLPPEYLTPPVAPDTTPPLSLDFRPSLVAEHEDLVLHFKGKEAAADPIAFEKSMVDLLAHHPYFAELVKRAEHKPVAHSGTCNCCSVELKLPHLSEQEYQKLAHALASTAAESLTPLVDAPHVPAQSAAHASGTPIVAPAQAHAEGAAHAVAPAAPHPALAAPSVIAKDDQSPMLAGKVGNPQIAAAR